MAGHITSACVSVPHTFRVGDASLDVGEVAVGALGATSSVEGVPLAIVVSGTEIGVGIGRAGGLAAEGGGRPLAHGLGFAASLVGESGTRLDADCAAVVPFAEGISVAEISTRVLDGALGSTLLELEIPFAHVLAEVAFGFRDGGRAVEVTLSGDGVPFAASDVVAGGLGAVGASLAVVFARSTELHGSGVAERIGVAGIVVEVEGTGVLASSSSRPLTLSVGISIASSGGEVTSGAAVKAHGVGRIRHAQGSDTAVHHGGDGRALLSAEVAVVIPDAVGVGLADFSSLTLEAAASLAGSLSTVEVAGGLALAFAESEGVVGVDEDFRAGGGTRRGFRIPHAASIEDAGTLCRVEIRAVAEATLSGHTPSALSRARALTGIGDGEAAEKALGVLLIPFALRIGVTFT